MAQNDTAKNGNGGNLGFEADLFKAADKLRGNMEPSDYKHVALGLISKDYARPALNKVMLGELIDLISGIALNEEGDGEPFEEKMQRLSALWRKQRAEAVRLDAAIEANLKALGYGG